MIRRPERSPGRRPGRWEGVGTGTVSRLLDPAALRAVFANAVEVVSLCDALGSVVWDAASAESVLSWDPDARVGLRFADLFAPEDRDDAAALWSQALAAPGAPAVGDLRVRSGDGAPRWCRVTCTSHLDVPGIGAVAVNQVDATAQRDLERRMRHGAFTDPLTGLPNRAGVLELLESSLAGHGPADQTALLIVDLDGFTVVNDSLGHGLGDLLLLAVAERLAATLRDHDALGRLGSDEFAVVLMRLRDRGEVGRAAKRVLDALAEPFTVGGRDVVLSASLGVAWPDAGPRRAERVLRHADLAVHRAKERGRGTQELYDPELARRARHRMEVEHELRRALDRDQFTVRYQPIVSATTGELEHVEALLRWAHPDLGVLPPADWFAVAEDIGLVGALGRMVLDRATRDAGHLGVAVNVSAHQFGPQLIEGVADVLAATSVPARSLTLEITETLAMRDVRMTVLLLERLKSLGVRLAIDDFGTGYSSLEYLHRFPIDELKIDRAFVKRIGPDSDSPIVTATIAMAHQLGCIVVAEGVETPWQLEVLRAEGCDLVQGYLVGRPVDEVDVVALGRTTRALLR